MTKQEALSVLTSAIMDANGKSSDFTREILELCGEKIINWFYDNNYIIEDRTVDEEVIRNG